MYTNVVSLVHNMTLEREHQLKKNYIYIYILLRGCIKTAAHDIKRTTMPVSRWPPVIQNTTQCLGLYHREQIFL